MCLKCAIEFLISICSSKTNAGSRRLHNEIAHKHLFVGSGSADVVTALIQVLARPTVQGDFGQLWRRADAEPHFFESRLPSISV